MDARGEAEIRAETALKRRSHAASLAVPLNGSGCSAWLGKPVPYRLSYVRAPRILAALLASAFHGRRQLSAKSAVPERGTDARS
jgi:hypothetical protein